MRARNHSAGSEIRILNSGAEAVGSARPGCMGAIFWPIRGGGGRKVPLMAMVPNWDAWRKRLVVRVPRIGRRFIAVRPLSLPLCCGIAQYDRMRHASLPHYGAGGRVPGLLPIVATLTVVAFFAIVAITSNPTSAPDQPLHFSDRKDPSIQIIGAARRVSGSAFLITAPDAEILIDCGMFYPESDTLAYDEDRVKTDQLNSIAPVSPHALDAIVLTHAHLDHVGRIPLMVNRGYRGPIFATPITRDLCEVMFEMALWSANFGVETFRYSERSGVVHSRAECEWARRILKPKRVRTERSRLEDYDKRLCGSCRRLELRQIMALFQVYDYHEKLQVSGSTDVEFYDPKHIPGSASILVTVRARGGSRAIFFSGDIGSGIDTLQKGSPEIPPEVDVLVVETTYGNSSRRLAEEPFSDFIQDLGRALEEGKLVWVPAFAMDRTQKVTKVIRDAQEAGKLPSEIDIKVLSATAKRANQIYDRHFTFRPRTVDESLDYQASLVALKRPVVVISASFLDAMEMFHGTIVEMLSSPEVLVMIVGYQDPRSIGGRLQNSRSNVRVGAIDVTVSATVERYGSFSGHADGPGIVEYVRRSNPAQAVILTHGSFGGMMDLQPQLEEWLDVPVLAPEANEVVPLFSGRAARSQPLLAEEADVVVSPSEDP